MGLPLPVYFFTTVIYNIKGEVEEEPRSMEIKKFPLKKVNTLKSFD